MTSESLHYDSETGFWQDNAGGWWFFDEDGACRCGPFTCRTDCIEVSEAYSKFLADGVTHAPVLPYSYSWVGPGR